MKTAVLVYAVKVPYFSVWLWRSIAQRYKLLVGNMATTSPSIPDPMENLSPVFGHRRPFSPSAMLNPRSQLDGTPRKVGYLMTSTQCGNAGSEVWWLRFRNKANDVSCDVVWASKGVVKSFILHFLICFKYFTARHVIVCVAGVWKGREREILAR